MKKETSRNNRIEFGDIVHSSFSELLDNEYAKSRKVIIVDENTHDNCLEYLITTFDPLVDAEVMLLPPGEENKVMEVCFQVWNALSEYEIGRKDLVINLGGGVVTDMGGFIASIYKRGVDFIHIPTSLLGMVDAALGGKSGIDLGPYKNQLGVYKDAKAIYIDPLFLGTLPEAEMWNGYAEMMKHALVSDRNFWKKLIAIEDFKALQDLELIREAAEIKLNIVAEDPLEDGKRKLLNFGHTIGHGIEGYLLEKENPISHGHAVAIGILLESLLSFKRGVLSESSFAQIEKQIRQRYPLIGMESQEEIQAIIKIIHNDKKNFEGEIKGILITGIGHCEYDVTYTDKELKQVLSYLRLN